MSTPLSRAIKRLETFAKERKKCIGTGWPEVTSNEIFQLQALVQAIVEAKWQRDCDGDVPVQIILIDRTRFEPMHYALIAYDHKTTNQGELDLILVDLMSNVRIATGALQSFLQNSRNQRQQDARQQTRERRVRKWPRWARGKGGAGYVEFTAGYFGDEIDIDFDCVTREVVDLYTYPDSSVVTRGNDDDDDAIEWLPGRNPVFVHAKDPAAAYKTLKNDLIFTDEEEAWLASPEGTEPPSHGE